MYGNTGTRVTNASPAMRLESPTRVRNEPNRRMPPLSARYWSRFSKSSWQPHATQHSSPVARSRRPHCGQRCGSTNNDSGGTHFWPQCGHLSGVRPKQSLCITWLHCAQKVASTLNTISVRHIMHGLPASCMFFRTCSSTSPRYRGPERPANAECVRFKVAAAVTSF